MIIDVYLNNEKLTSWVGEILPRTGEKFFFKRGSYVVADVHWAVLEGVLVCDSEVRVSVIVEEQK